MSLQQGTIVHFDAEAARYRTRFSSGVLGRLRREERRAVYALLEPAPGDVILDAGCGPGTDAVPLLELGCQVEGVDVSPRMVEQARAHGVPAQVVDLHELDLSRHFDKILCCGPLEFCTDPARVIGRLAAHLNPGGRLVLLFPTPANGGMLYRFYHRTKNGLSIRLFSIGEMLDLAHRAGLVGRRCERPSSFSMVISAERI